MQVQVRFTSDRAGMPLRAEDPPFGGVKYNDQSSSTTGGLCSVPLDARYDSSTVELTNWLPNNLREQVFSAIHWH